MRIYSSILLSSLLLVGGTNFHKPSSDRLSPLIFADSELGVIAQGENPDNACSRGTGREECYSQSIQLTNDLDRHSETETSDDIPRGTGRNESERTNLGIFQ